jgi:uncharacterized damage-inducible protein DinB
MKEIIADMAGYNVWAHRRITDVIVNLEEELTQQLIPGSFPNLYSTVLHMWDAESIWWQRIKLHERLVIPSEAFNPSMKEVINGLIAQAQQWEEFARSANEVSLTHVIAFQNSKKELFKQPVWQVMMHVFNHGTYHRGQCIQMLRALEQEKLPATDFIVYTRGKR